MAFWILANCAVAQHTISVAELCAGVSMMEDHFMTLSDKRFDKEASFAIDAVQLISNSTIAGLAEAQPQYYYDVSINSEVIGMGSFILSGDAFALIQTNENISWTDPAQLQSLSIEESPIASGTTLLMAGLKTNPTGGSSGLTKGEQGTFSLTVRVWSDGCPTAEASSTYRAIPGGLTLLAPIFTIVTAFATRQVIPALIVGTVTGAFFLHGYNPIVAVLRTFDLYLVEAVADFGHACVILFTFFLGGLVAVIAKSGGMAGAARDVTACANTPMKTQLATWCLGIAIFFDDCPLLLSFEHTFTTSRADRRWLTHTARDRCALGRRQHTPRGQLDATDHRHDAHLSREALLPGGRLLRAHRFHCADLVVDRLRARAAGRWPRQARHRQERVHVLPRDAADGTCRVTHIGALPPQLTNRLLLHLRQRFYPFFMIFFGFSIILMKRDFGPMLAAERRARQTGALIDPAAGSHAIEDLTDSLLEPKEGLELKSSNAIVPILFVVGTVFVGLICNGANHVGDDEMTFINMFANADSFAVLIWASIIGLIVPMIMYKCQRIMTCLETFETWMAGLKPLVEPLIVLICAWALGSVVDQTHLSDFVAEGMEGVSIEWLPTLVFILSAVIALATGSSWGCMAVMFPLVFDLAWQIGGQKYGNLVPSLSSILAGSVFGDHCSPISDTTILSAISTKCPTQDHVITQLPYALTCGALAMLLGTMLNSAGGVGEGWCILIGLIAIIMIVRLFGRKSELLPDQDAADAEAAAAAAAAAVANEPSEPPTDSMGKAKFYAKKFSNNLKKWDAKLDEKLDPVDAKAAEIGGKIRTSTVEYYNKASNRTSTFASVAVAKMGLKRNSSKSPRAAEATIVQAAADVPTEASQLPSVSVSQVTSTFTNNTIGVVGRANRASE